METKLKKEAKDELKYIILPIDGMTCASCVARVKNSLEQVSWVRSVDVNLAAEQAAIGFEVNRPHTADLKTKVEKAGYRLRSRVSDIVIPGFNDPTRTQSLLDALKQVPGVEDCSFNTTNETLSLHYIPGFTSVVPVEKIIRVETGVHVIWREVSPVIDKEHEKKKREVIRRQFRNSIFSIASALVVFFLTMPGLFGFVRAFPQDIRFGFSFLLTGWVLFYAGRSLFKGFFYKLTPGRSDMNTLVAMGSGSAFIYSLVVMLGVMFDPHFFGGYHVFFDSAAFIVGFILLGRSLEARARMQTGESLKALAELQPEKARRQTEGSSVEILAIDLNEGDVSIVLNGERVPADGVLLSDFGEVDESMLSGESLPVTKFKGQLILTGTINTGGEMRFRVIKTGQDTALGQIVQWVRQAQNSQPPVQKLVDKIAAVFVPTVISLAFLTLIVWAFSGAAVDKVIMHFINVIVVACPCALGLATPTAIVVSMGRAVRAGMLIKNAAVLENTHHMDTILFDKTGTLTTGKLSLSRVVSFNMNEEELLAFAVSLEKNSTHPIAKAITEVCKTRKISAVKSENVQIMTGYGLTGIVDDQNISMGNRALMDAMAVNVDLKNDETAAALKQERKTVIWMASGDKLIGLLAFEDKLREEAKSVLAELHGMGIRTEMVTGDAETTADSIAAQAGINKIYAEKPPQVKAKVVDEIREKGRMVAFIGDGINDAVALTRADVGIAMAEGTDVALQSADIVLLRPDLTLLVELKKLSSRTERIIKQNLGWAFGYNVIMLPMAAGLFYLIWGVGFDPAFAALAMAMSSVSVVSNSLRLRK